MGRSPTAAFGTGGARDGLGAFGQGQLEGQSAGRRQEDQGQFGGRDQPGGDDQVDSVTVGIEAVPGGRYQAAEPGFVKQDRGGEGQAGANAEVASSGEFPIA